MIYITGQCSERKFGSNTWRGIVGKGVADMMPGSARSQFGDVGDRRQTFHQRAIQVFGGAKLGLVAIAFNGQSRKMRGVYL